MKTWLPVPNPIAFTVFGLEIRWYAILIVTGMMIAYFICEARAPKKGLVKEHFIDYFLCGVPAAIIGARLYYVIFEWENYKGNLKAILDIRSGGLAIHGGLIGAVIAMYFVARHYKEDLIAWVDLVLVTWPLGQAIGRWGNYFNSEAHGGPTDLPWAIYVDGEYVHPTFLYESVWCFLLFLFLLWWDESGRTKFTGQITCFYMILYSVERFFVEGLRTDSLYIGSLRQAQVLSLVIIALGIVLYFVFKKRYEKQQLAAYEAETTEEIVKESVDTEC